MLWEDDVHQPPEVRFLLVKTFLLRKNSFPSIQKVENRKHVLAQL